MYFYYIIIFNFLFLISLGFGANSFLLNSHHNINNQAKSNSFTIPDTLRLVGIMAEFVTEFPDNPKTSGTGKFLNNDYSLFEEERDFQHFLKNTYIFTVI